MQQTHTSPLTNDRAAAAPRADRIPSLGHAEAARLAAAELDRFIALLETLEGADWDQPTYCTLWDVKEIAAHQAGSLKGWSSRPAFFAQSSKANIGPYRDKGLNLLDAMNQYMVDSRAEHSPADLIAEIRDIGPRAVACRADLPALVRGIPIYSKDLGGWRKVGYLTDTIYSRDMWMHRVDICRATGREFVQTPEHDGRMVALVVRDYGTSSLPDLGGQSIRLELTGPAGGSWIVGKGRPPAATIRMDALDFAVLVSGRMSSEDARAQSLVEVEGDTALAHRVLDTSWVPF